MYGNQFSGIRLGLGRSVKFKYNVPGTEYLDVSGVQMVNEEQRMYKSALGQRRKDKSPISGRVQ